ncbi:MAG: hypothetical protein R3Y61_05450 [Rikenellaceae bacterium]
MLRKLKNQIAKLMQRVVSTSFLLILLVAFVMWFVMKLSREYTTPIDVDVVIQDDFNSSLWTQHKTVKVRLLARGDGRDLIYYKAGLGASVSVNTSQLELSHSSLDNEYLYSISESSMERALNSVEKKFNVVAILDTIPRVVVSEIIEKKVPVVSSIRVNCLPQFIVEGGVTLSLDSVSIRGPRMYVDEVQKIYTRSLVVDDVDSNLWGTITLESPSEILLEQTSVRYSVKIVGYTEQILEEKIISIESGSTLVVPSSVIIKAKVSLGEDLEDNEAGVEAYVDGETVESTGVIRRVKIRNMPSEVISYTLSPEFVEVFSVQ